MPSATVRAVNGRGTAHQGGSVTDLSAETLDLLDHTLDIDAHEMTPSHLWGEVFGAAAARIAELAEPVLKKTGANDFYNPSVAGDLEEITDENVWNIRGSRAPGAFDMTRRIAVMDVMGVARQFVFPSFALFANHLYAGNEATHRDRYGLTLPEDEIRKLGLDGITEYNDWVVRESQVDPERVRPVAYVSPGSSPEELFEQTKDLIDRGVLAINLPAGEPPGGRSPASPDLDPYWQMLADRNIAVLVHVGGETGFVKSPDWSRAPAFKPGKVESHELGSEPFSFATVSFPICNYLTAMTLGGVFERHPNLRFGAIEIGAGWLGPWADNLDMWARDVYAARMKPFISKLPSEYIASNVRVTPFNNFEPVDKYLAAYPHLRTSYCWSTDYPHIEGGKDIKRKFLKMLAPMGDEVIQQFFVTNSELLLPPLTEIRKNA
ncbi:amidohydrolase family protein [Streptosporangium sp. NPDC002544]|uniref:amidohydrolase family protein n=1 Tax=Streptosporangium sp. NPDC002544 TaxID=3154538 RepID=UPI00332C4554